MSEFEEVQNNDEQKKNNSWISILLVVLVSSIVFIIVQYTGRCHRCIPMTKAEADKAFIDEIIARVELCIMDFDIERINVIAGDYIYDGNETICSSAYGQEFARFITASFEGASSVSKVDPNKDNIKITLEKNNNGKYGYNITAKFVES